MIGGLSYMLVWGNMKYVIDIGIMNIGMFIKNLELYVKVLD